MNNSSQPYFLYSFFGYYLYLKLVIYNNKYINKYIIINIQ